MFSQWFCRIHPDLSNPQLQLRKPHSDLLFDTLRRQLRREAIHQRPFFSATLHERMLKNLSERQLLTPVDHHSYRKWQRQFLLATAGLVVTAGVSFVMFKARWENTRDFAVPKTIAEWPLFEEINESVFENVGSLAATAVGVPQWSQMVDFIGRFDRFTEEMALAMTAEDALDGSR